MFYDVKNQIDNPVIRELLSASAFDNSSTAMDAKAAEFRRRDDWQLYGWKDNDKVVGVCSFKAHLDYVEILNIAVAENTRHHGIGKAMVIALQGKYKMAVEAETDDDAVAFYRKCGFETTAFQKYNTQRYTCLLPIKNFKSD